MYQKDPSFDVRVSSTGSVDSVTVNKCLRFRELVQGKKRFLHVVIQKLRFLKCINFFVRLNNSYLSLGVHIFDVKYCKLPYILR